MTREPIEWVEIDVDQCTHTYGSGLCAAVLGTTGELKCFNTFKTCQDKDNYSQGTITYRYSKPQSRIPYDVGVFPVLESVSTWAGMVNIAGADSQLNALGKREKITFKMKDFPYHDRYTDKYASERVSGAAQSSGIGYNPQDRGTHFGKLRARWPYYAGRAARHCYGFMDGGVLTDVVTKHYILTDMEIDIAGGYAEFTAKDILYLVDNDKAVAPVASVADLLLDITDTATELTLTPENIGDEYPTEGRAIVGSEMFDYTRSGDVVTMTSRGVRGTEISSHSEGSAFQTVFTVTDARIDDTIYDLLVNYGGVDPAFCPVSDWADEVSRWAPSLRLTVDVTKSTGVNTLIGELSILGLSIWWDSELQLIGLKINRPPDEDTVYEISDDRNIMEDAISIDDRDDKRLTQVGFYSSIIGPTGSTTDANNYSRLRQLIDRDAQSVQEFNDTKIKNIFTRWLGDGNDSLIRILGTRLLNRFRWSPSRYKMTIRYDQDIKLTDVIRVNSRIHQDDTGLNLDKLMQVEKITIDKPKFQATIEAQTYQFDQRYGFITENTRGTYTASTDAQRARGVYFCDNTTLKMTNGDNAYQFI